METHDTSDWLAEFSKVRFIVGLHSNITGEQTYENLYLLRHETLYVDETHTATREFVPAATLYIDEKTLIDLTDTEIYSQIWV